MTAALSGEPLGASVSSPLDLGLSTDPCVAPGSAGSSEVKTITGASSRVSSRPSTPLPPGGGSPFYRGFLSPLCDRICLHIVPPSVSPDFISFLALCCAGAATLFCCYADGDFVGSAAGNVKCTTPQDSLRGTTSLPETVRRSTSAWWAVAGVLWMLYSVLDNVDGKQVKQRSSGAPGWHVCEHSSLWEECSRAQPAKGVL